MLRLRANYLWPAMWNNAFNEDDPENPRLADEYGIVMGIASGTDAAWATGVGSQSRETIRHWNYNNRTSRRRYSNSGARACAAIKNYESIITIGFRGGK